MMHRRETFILIGFAALLALTLPAAQEAEEEQEQPVERPSRAIEPPIDRPPSYYAFGDPPPPVEKVYDKRKRKVWSAVMKALKGEDLPVEIEDREKGHLKTKLIVFQRRWGKVATRPPDISMERPIIQFMGMNTGRVSVEIHVIEVPEGTLVSIRAYLEEHARHLKQQRRIWVERYSNGKIEGHLFERIDEILR